ncbi:MAG TPA: FtsX-like permease family protein [Puia sp.]|nr:FtsX-like permease family protein [Puia sp.]
MFKNYLLVAIRHFWRNKIFSFINIIGLSIGISAALVIFLIVHYDLTFDKFHKDSDRIYRIVTEERNENGAVGHMRGVPEPLAAAVAGEATGVEYTAPFYLLNDEPVSVPVAGSKPILFRHQKDLIFAGPSYFSVFNYKWLAGSPATALQEPFHVVLTLDRAKTYFPGLSPNAMIGRTITYFDSIPIQVSGIVHELEGNTDFVFAEFISFSTMTSNSLKDHYYLDWPGLSSSMMLFVKLSKGTTQAAVEARLKGIQAKYDPEAAVNQKNTKTYRTFLLEPLSDLHLNDTYGSFDTVRRASTSALKGLTILAVILLLLAVINFVNLTTARASQRAREIGIRKTIGSSRRQLILQFLGETFMTTFVATVVSVGLVPVLLKIFSDFIPPDLHFSWLHQPVLAGFLLLLLFGVSLLSGFYPAIVLSSFLPVNVLRGSFLPAAGQGTRSSVLRKMLTVSQFVIAQVFVIATLIVGRQIEYMLTRDLGFRQKAIVYTRLPWNDTSITRRLALLNELRAIPGIAAASLGGNPPSSSSFWGMSLVYRGGREPVKTQIEWKFGDTSFLPLYQIPLVAGRNLLPSDTVREYLINETYARQLGFKHPWEALNKNLYRGPEDSLPKPIVGVVRDFYAHSLHQEINPLVFVANTKQSHTIHLALASQDRSDSWASTLKAVEAAYKKFYPDGEFKYDFFDESIARFYKSEQDTAGLLRWATAVAILISCLGMLGLVVYTTTLRNKEIGIRKVMGATVTQIVALLSGEFMLLVGIAFLIATPIAWLGMDRFLRDYPIRPAFGWWLILLAGAGMAVIAALTLCLQTVRAARANPVKSLRTD